jgi:hypothetical protein
LTDSDVEGMVIVPDKCRVTVEWTARGRGGQGNNYGLVLVADQGGYD